MGGGKGRGVQGEARWRDKGGISDCIARKAVLKLMNRCSSVTQSCNATTVAERRVCSLI